MKRVLVYGGKGALGATCVKHFRAQGWWVCSLDLVPNTEADSNVVVQPSNSWTEQSSAVVDGIYNTLGDDKLDAVLCVAGGWAGGNAIDKDFIKNSETTWKQSVWTSTIAAHLSCKHLKEDGVLVLTGAQAALGATAGMIGYGMAKAAVHQLVQSLARKKSGMPSTSHTLAILPVTLDTPMNRKFMPEADHTTWTPLEFVAGLLYKWASNEERPPSGSLVQLLTKDSLTETVISSAFQK